MGQPTYSVPEDMLPSTFNSNSFETSRQRYVLYRVNSSLRITGGGNGATS